MDSSISVGHPLHPGFKEKRYTEPQQSNIEFDADDETGV